MANISIKQVETKSEMKKFIRFNYELYKDNKYSVPDIYEDMLDTFSDKNAAMEFCEAVYYLAYKDGKVVGRVAGIINNKANKTWNLNAVRFGWIDFIDDPEVSRALIEAVEKWGRSKGMTEIQGPLGFTDMDAEGMLIEGFEELGTMATIYNYPYYPKHIEALGYEKEADWIEMFIKVPRETGLPDRFKRIAEIVMQKYNLQIKKYTSSKKLAADYGQEIFQLINEAFKPLFGYSELSQKQIDQYVKTYLPILDLKLISLITEPDGRLVGVGISMPSMSRALQKAKGKMFPFGWWHLLKALKWKKPKILDLMLVAIKPEYQGKGVNSLLFYDLLPIYVEEGYEYVETNVELESNSKVQQQWIYFERRQHKRRRCFKKTL
ncbi:MAG: GNAT family N-acetyltransferase [Bacteroidaceae bacterium]|jgi:GNAT superfamily N-acetyltransferase|nr:GNAT family N-acetyltransferase [Bacteroidaceae bacterium]